MQYGANKGSDNVEQKWRASIIELSNLLIRLMNLYSSISIQYMDHSLFKHHKFSGFYTKS